MSTRRSFDILDKFRAIGIRSGVDDAENRVTEAVFTKSVKKQPLQIRGGIRKRVSRETHPVAMRPSRTEW